MTPTAATRRAHPLGRYRDAVFFASGFAGLVYESIWAHYLKLFLGHAAYAQTLVLGIFMGGMAIGAAVAGRRSSRIVDPLRAYACVEFGVGALALVFPAVFVAATEGFYGLAAGGTLGPQSVVALRWILAALLILPQSVLLGATFPLFAAAAVRHAPSAAGRSIAALYFANSLGGAFGVLASGFVLTPYIGLHWTIAVAGALNLAIAGIVLRAGTATAGSPSPPLGDDSARPSREISPTAKLLLAASFFTGAASFIYEIGWIRMLSLVLGGATHSFELMLSSFVLGLALGGWWVRGRIDRTPDLGALLGRVQIAMGIAALATVPLHAASFDVLETVIRALPRTDGGYALFNLIRYGIASAIMLPAAFFAGTTLPLATKLLQATGRGERAIGAIYSINTLGSICGLAAAVHLGFALLGLEYLVAFGAAIDILLGAVLLVAFGGRARIGYAAAAIVAGAVGAIVAGRSFDPQKLASGVYRTSKALAEGTVLEIAHGKTATVSVERSGDAIAIKTNGKPDASANVVTPSAYTLDQVTASLSAAFPLMLHTDPRRVANIGLGSGVTAATLLDDLRVAALDTIEIEPKMVTLARHFSAVNAGVYDDPRSAIHIDDARSYFAAQRQRYDVIVSEPSNPWVSGVANLFTVEYYRHVTRYLNPGGLFAQWIQTYETQPQRVVSVLKAIDAAFDDYIVVSLNAGDLLLVASPHGSVRLQEGAYDRLSPALRKRLRTLDIANQGDVILRIVGNKAMFAPWLGGFDVPVNSDFVPYLDTHADHDRFLNTGWDDIHRLALSPIPLAEILGGRPPLPNPAQLTFSRQFGPEPPWTIARLAKRQLLDRPRAIEDLALPDDAAQPLAEDAAQIPARCVRPRKGGGPLGATRLGARLLPYLSPAEGQEVLAALRGAACLEGLYGAAPEWPSMLGHVAGGEASRFGAQADALLERGQGSADETASYLLGLAMLGRVVDGNGARAEALWQRFGKQAAATGSSQLAYQILRAHALARVVR